MGTADTVAALANFEGRGAGTNAERRAALWLASELRGGRRTVETFWCRPNWALAHAWHTALGIAGSLVCVASPKVGAAMVLVALVSLAVDGLTGVSLGRRLSPEHASQNVISRLSSEPASFMLVITANYDAGRMGLAYRPTLRRAAALANRAIGNRAPGWEAWLALGFICVLAAAVVRAAVGAGTTLDVLQLIATAALALALGVLLELAGAPFGPSAGDNGSGVALAIALARTLEANPLHQLGVEVVLQGAGDGAMIGLSRYLRARRSERTAANTIVLGIGPCGAGRRHWWTSDGSLIPLRFSRRLAQIARGVAGTGAELGAAAHRGRGASPAYPGRFAGLPAITIGCLDRDGLPPRSHRPSDRPEALDRGAAAGLLEFALALVNEIHADLAQTASDKEASSRTAA